MSDCYSLSCYLDVVRLFVCFTSFLPSKISAACDACDATEKAKHAEQEQIGDWKSCCSNTNRTSPPAFL